MGTLNGCSNLITLNFRTTINGVPSLSSSTHKKTSFSNQRFGMKSITCYLCQESYRRELSSTLKNGGLFHRLVCFSRGSDEDGDCGSSSSDFNLATKETEKEIIVEDNENIVDDLRSESKQPSSFSSSSSSSSSSSGVSCSKLFHFFSIRVHFLC